jgi:phosphatidylinositol-4,5-bisphosphate 3-kinase
MHDSSLNRYLLQLVQCLKFEIHHNNALIRMLMRRALMNPEQIGHHFYWHLRSEYFNPFYCERFGLYMEEYLVMCFNHARSYVTQHNILKHLSFINDRLQVLRKFERNKENKKYSKDELNAVLRQCLTHLNERLFSDITTSSNSSFVLPINPRWRLTKLNVAGCRIMRSAQMPLWLEFTNSDEHSLTPNQILFKTGDDLRQDILTLQMLKCMDKVWLDRGLDLRLMPYSVVATDCGTGMVEIVHNSRTTTDIHTAYGGGAQRGARDATTHWQYLHEHNRESSHSRSNGRESDFDHARDIYTRSCAGYCIASYVLGLGDRHPSNIMIREKGELFHIDFSHFLGNFKSQAIIGDYVKWQRETSPFVFLPAMKCVIDNCGQDKNNYNRFLQYCCNAYLALRQRQRLFINLFILMIPSQMPELIEKQHIEYMRDSLHLRDIENEDVYNHILKIIAQCLNDKRRIMDNMFHAVKHQ